MADARLLLLETSAEVCSVAVSEGQQIIAELAVEDAFSHSEKLAGLVQDILANTNLEYSDLDGVALSAGPGSYTGLRIGCSLAKGICYASGLPLIACSSLRALAVAGWETWPDAGVAVCMIDARRMDAYTAVYDRPLNEVQAEEFCTLDKHVYVDYLDRADVCFVGSGVEKWKNMHLAPQLKEYKSGMYARFLLPEAHAKFLQKSWEDTVLFEPNYIKAVHVTKPKVKF